MASASIIACRPALLISCYLVKILRSSSQLHSPQHLGLLDNSLCAYTNRSLSWKYWLLLVVCVVVFLLVCGCCILFLLVTYYFSVFSAATCDPHVGASMFALTCHLRAFSFAVIKNITYASYNSCVSLHFYVVAFEAGCNILTAGIATLSRRRSSDPCNHHCVWIVSQQLLISLKLELPDRCCAHSLYCCGDPS